MTDPKTYTTEQVAAATNDYYDGKNDLAGQIFPRKYAVRQKGTDLYLEETPADMHVRLASEFARIEYNYTNAVPYDTILAALERFGYIVPQGSVMMGAGNDEYLTSLSNCLVISSPTDSITGIFQAATDMANLFKRRCGVGVALDNLRPEGSHVNNAAVTTTGAWSFADLFSRVVKKIGQNGRRGALMIGLDGRHPDAFSFATMKADRQEVTGANVSIKVFNDFMEAVVADDEYTLHWPCGSDNPSVTNVIRAKDLWDTIIERAWADAEPGVLFWDNITNMLPADKYESFRTLITNPCGEIPLSAGDSCRLISINLKSFTKDKRWTDEAYFDFEKFEETVRLTMRLADDLVDLEIEKLTEIRNLLLDSEGNLADEADAATLRMWNRVIQAATDGRRTGIGAHGLADCLAQLSLPYDSDEAIALADKIWLTYKVTAYKESIELAKERGPFPAFDWDTEKDCDFFKGAGFEDILDDMAKYGRRNISILTCAPTGSVAIMSETGSGIEPYFRTSYNRKRKLSPGEDRTGAIKGEAGEWWLTYPIYECTPREYMEMFRLEDGTYPELPDFFSESDSIDWIRRVDMQAAIQQHVDHSISSTINLPRGTSKEAVSEIYIESWKRGLKGVTVYIEGSREGVLTSTDTPAQNDAELQYHDAPKRPEVLPCELHNVHVEGVPYVLLVGLLNGRPFEIFGGQRGELAITADLDLVINKHPRKSMGARYELAQADGTIIARDIVKTFDNADHSVHTRMISLALRHGAEPAYIAEQIMKGDTTSSLRSFTRVINRVVKSYVQDGRVSKAVKSCPECGGSSFKYQDGCLSCVDCGWSKCS